VPSNSSTKLHVINLCIVCESAGFPSMMSFSAFRSSGSGRRSAVITASVTMRCCERGQRKTGVKVHFLCRTGVATTLSHRRTPYDRRPLRGGTFSRNRGSNLTSGRPMMQLFRHSSRDTDKETLLRVRQRLQQIKSRLVDLEARVDSGTRRRARDGAMRRERGACVARCNRSCRRRRTQVYGTRRVRSQRHSRPMGFIHCRPISL
jgi:hypothetical protein